MWGSTTHLEIGNSTQEIHSWEIRVIICHCVGFELDLLYKSFKKMRNVLLVGQIVGVELMVARITYLNTNMIQDYGK